MFASKRSILVLCLAIAAGCSPIHSQTQPTQTPQIQPTKTPFNPDQDMFNTYMKLWDSQNITHYQFKLDVVSLLDFPRAMPVTIEVRDNKMLSILDSNGFSLENDDLKKFEAVDTIPKLFNLTWQGILTADMAEVSYDRKLGFPNGIYIDPNREMLDDAASYYVVDFKILP